MRLEFFLSRRGVVDSAAVDFPADYDKGITLDRIREAEHDFIADLVFRISSRSTSGESPCDNQGMAATVEEGTARKPVDANARPEPGETIAGTSKGDILERPEITDKATGIEAIVCEDIANRQRDGILKYGTTVAANPLPLRAWLQHAYQEHLDAAIYLRRAICEMQINGL